MVDGSCHEINDNIEANDSEASLSERGMILKGKDTNLKRALEMNFERCVT